ncbi:hydrogenase maturation nickel metallochaperone HypA [Candidatus Woesearchaeota archaeon]|nr:hydrogenase maturation nickel metallochaperone HypA [Candidatus Woesearchaeota archaeon]
MHEIVIAERIVKEAKKFGDINEVSIVLGELCNITKDELQGAIQTIVNWKIDILVEESKIECSCDYSGKANIIDKGHGYCIFNCPNCHKKPSVIKGGDIRIIGVK